MELAERITEYLEWPRSHHAANQIIIELMNMLEYAEKRTKSGVLWVDYCLESAKKLQSQ